MSAAVAMLRAMSKKPSVVTTLRGQVDALEEANANLRRMNAWLHRQRQADAYEYGQKMAKAASATQSAVREALQKEREKFDSERHSERQTWIRIQNELQATQRYCQRIEAELRKTGWKPEDPVHE